MAERSGITRNRNSGTRAVSVAPSSTVRSNTGNRYSSRRPGSGYIPGGATRNFADAQNPVTDINENPVTANNENPFTQQNPATPQNAAPVLENAPVGVQKAGINWIVPALIIGGFLTAKMLKKKKSTPKKVKL